MGIKFEDVAVFLLKKMDGLECEWDGELLSCPTSYLDFVQTGE